MALPTLRNDLQITGDWMLSYIHTSPDFPLGNIGDPDTPAADARKLIEDWIDYQYGPVIHVSLAHKEHNLVHLFEEMPKAHVVISADGAIAEKRWDVAIGTLLGDCNSIVVVGPDYIGFIHAGRPELFGGIVPAFMEKWPDNNEYTDVYIGPGICGDHYELPQIPEGIANGPLGAYKTQTKWDTQGFDVTHALMDEFMRHGVQEDNIFELGGCPFCAQEEGETWWASDQWYRVHQMVPEQKYSPRDLALLHPIL